eukprot:Phypoly_transcript_12982.p1 GENE.Phypoly_transcript_12982~~Phypoly_transcript_12982.p1  ORF type:complete len:228 (+),score=37.85 Phypoly_transcript_12982:161-844(+)
MEDESDDDVEIVQVKKKLKRDDEEDYSHFVSVYDIDTGTEHLEEKQGKVENMTTSGAPDESYSTQCPICLQPVDNPTIPDSCIHQFCFICILQWSQLTRTQPTCPICKQPFSSLIHSMTSSKEFRVHYLEKYKQPTTTTTSTNSNINTTTNGTRTPNQPYRTRVDHTNVLQNDLYSDVLMLRRAVYTRKLKAIPQSHHTFPQRPQLTQQQVTPTLIHKLYLVLINST